jgi:PAS domain S-box-containing protein
LGTVIQPGSHKIIEKVDSSITYQSKRMGIDTAYQEIQARLTGIIASAMDAIITINDNQRIVQFNAAAENMFGYPTEEVVGRPLEQLIPERYRSRLREHIRQFGKTGVTNRAMGRLGTLYGLRSNGDEFPIEASISQIKTDTGNLYTVILRDVTERVEAEDKLIESEQQLRATFEQAAVGITHLAPDGRMRIANDRFCEIFAVVDVWDALRSDRPYRSGWPEDKVIQHIRDGTGKDFDPKVAGAFLEILKSAL